MAEHLGAAAAQLGQRVAVAALEMVEAVVGDLVADGSLGGRLVDPQVEPGLELTAQRRRGRLELEQRAERVEQDRAGRAQATHRHAANPAVSTTSPIALTIATGTVTRWRRAHSASHM